MTAGVAVAAVTLDRIVSRLGGSVAGDGTVEITRIASLDNAGPGAICFLANPKYRSQLAATRAAAVILGAEAVADCPVPCIVTTQPYLYFARLTQWLTPAGLPAPGIHPSAVVEAAIPATVTVGPGVWIAAGARIGPHVIIDANSSIGSDVEIGADTHIHSNVSIGRNCRIGCRAILHAGVVVGSDGFGFARESDGSWVKIPQNGRVLIGDDVEIGANTTIDRGAIDDTIIEDGVKLDNQIQVGHNVIIGAHTAMAGCVGIAGSARIGRRCTVGGGAIILGHLEIGDDVNISASTVVSRSIPRAGSYTGTVPTLTHDQWLKNFAHLRHLDTLADRIRALESRLAELEKKS